MFKASSTLLRVKTTIPVNYCKWCFDNKISFVYRPDLQEDDGDTYIFHHNPDNLKDLQHAQANIDLDIYTVNRKYNGTDWEDIEVKLEE